MAKTQFGNQSAQTNHAVTAAAAAAAAAGSLLVTSRLQRPAGCEEVRTVPGIWVHQIGSNAPCEDRHHVRQLGPELFSAAVIDGHGGWQVANWISDELLLEVERRLAPKRNKGGKTLDCDGCIPSPKRVLVALEAAFAECDRKLMQQVENAGAALGGFSKALRQGACAVCTVVSPTHLLFANAGDCRACVIRDQKPVFVHSVHNANQPVEQKRLRDAHPGEVDTVVCQGKDGTWTGQQMLEAAEAGHLPSTCYVKDCVQPTRGFGDFYLKDARFNWMGFVKEPHSLPYVTVDPEVVAVERCPGDEVVVLGSDGLWDDLQGSDVARVVRETMANHCEAQMAPSMMAKVLAEALVDEATAAAARACGLDKAELQDMPPGDCRRKLVDDITCVVVVL
jgi:pyruvate dehydrogenase phosphatase